MSEPIATEESGTEIVSDARGSLDLELERRRADWRAAKEPLGRACLALGVVLMIVVIACAVAFSSR